jgi:cytochrome c oxidase cbb3-type subunit III
MRQQIQTYNEGIYMKKSILILLSFLLVGQFAFATSAIPEVTSGDTSSTSAIIIFVLCILIVLLIGLLFFLYSLGSVLQLMNGSHEGIVKKPLFDLTDAVPIEREHEILLDHNYDGIQELDNNLPTWWLWLFYATIGFAFVYFIYFQTSGYGDNQIQEYEKSMIAAEEEMKLHASKVDENSATVLTEVAAIESGKALFMENCAACHGKLGEGGVGPNFTDEYWLHGGNIKSIFKTVKFGVPQKGMIAWQSQISPVQIQEVSSYILTLKGTNPPNAKEAQGEIAK